MDKKERSDNEVKAQYKVGIFFYGLMGRQRKPQQNVIALGYFDVNDDLNKIKAMAIEKAKKEVKQLNQNKLMVHFDHVTFEGNIMLWQPFSKEHFRMDITEAIFNKGA